MVRVSVVSWVKGNPAQLQSTHESLRSINGFSVEWILISEDELPNSPILQEEWVIHKVVSNCNICEVFNISTHIAHGEYLLFLNEGSSVKLSDSQPISLAFNECTDIAWGHIVSSDSGYCYVYPQREDFSMFYLIEHNIPLQSTFIKRELLERLGGFDNDKPVAFDFAFFYKAVISNQCSVRFIPQLQVCAIPFVSFEEHMDRAPEIIKTVVAMYPRLVGDDNPQLRLPSEIHSAMRFWRFLQTNVWIKFAYNVFVKPFKKKH